MATKKQDDGIETAVAELQEQMGAEPVEAEYVDQIDMREYLTDELKGGDITPEDLHRQIIEQILADPENALNPPEVVGPEDVADDNSVYQITNVRLNEGVIDNKPSLYIAIEMHDHVDPQRRYVVTTGMKTLVAQLMAHMSTDNPLPVAVRFEASKTTNRFGKKNVRIRQYR